MPISPTAEGFRAAFRRPSLALAEITWRWVVGFTGTLLFLFGLVEYLNTLPVTNGELLFLRTRQPYLVAQAIAHILRGSLNRAVLSALVGAFLLGCLWILAASAGRIATLRAILDYFHEHFTGVRDASKVSTTGTMRALVRLNFLRAATALAAVMALVGAAILAGFASSAVHPRPGLVFLLFVPMAVLISTFSYALNWQLSLAAIFAVRDHEDAVGAISAAVAFSRNRAGAISAVTTWTGLAHLIAFTGATTAVSMPLGLAPILPWRLVTLAVLLLTLAYLALADWLYMARLAGYVCILEMPEPLLSTLLPPGRMQIAPTLQTTIDRDEPILSDLPMPTTS